jgi:hypothetical protein
MAGDRDDFFGDAHCAGRSDDPDRWPAGGEGPAGDTAASPTGKSSTVKVLLIVLAVLVIGALLCCGGIAIFGWFARPIQTTDNPAEVTAKTAEIADIELPDGFEPAMAIDMNLYVMRMQMAFYEATGGGVLMIAQAQGEGANEAQMEQQLRQSMQQQNLGEQLTVKESETKSITVGDREVDFMFSTATNNEDNSEWRQVSGAFPGKNGTAFLILQQPASSFDEEEVTGMLESIKTE